MKRVLATFLLLSLSCSLSFSESLGATASVERIQRIVQELQSINSEREAYLQELENTNSEREAELQQRIAELNERETELNELKLTLQLFGDLIDDQATYYQSLQKKLTFWRIISGILATSTITTLIIWSVSK